MKKAQSYFLAFLTSLLIFVGLALMGWGLAGLPLFFENPARTAYVLVIAVLQIAAIWYNPQVGRYNEQRQSGVPRHELDLILIQLFSLGIVVLAPFSDRRSLLVLGFGDIGRYIGLFLVVPGFLLMQAAEKYLARQFSIVVTLQENHKLIQSGPYKYIRHPRYLGILIFFLGIALTFRSLLAVLVAAAMIPVLVWRIRAEEALLAGEFGEAWEAYRRKSWRILPFIY